MNIEDLKSGLVSRKRTVQTSLDAIGIVETAMQALENMGCTVAAICVGDRVGFELDLSGVQVPGADPAPARAIDPAPSVADVAAAVESDPVVPAGRVSGPWSDAEKQRARDMWRDGMAKGDIARALRRAPQGVGLFISNLEKAAAVRCAAEARARVAPPETRPAEADLAPTMDRAAPRSGDDTRRSWAAYVAGLTYVDGWTVADDLRLCERLMCGDGLGNVAESLGRERHWLRARWQVLNQSQPPTIEGQKNLVEALRARRDAT